MDQSIHDVRRSNWLNIVNECQQMPANMTVKQSEIDLNYLGIAICGSKKKVNKLTGSMPLLR